MNTDTYDFIAMNRFGYGATTRDYQAIQNVGYKQWLASQLHSIDLPKPKYHSSQALKDIVAYNKLNKASKTEPSLLAKKTKLRKSIIKNAKQLSVTNTLFSSKTNQAIQARLLDFFSNHFSLSANNLILTALAPTLETEAIAPKLTGTFESMLQAVIAHPAMILYLNNERSTGPNSTNGKKRKKKGLNENLAREVMELYTMGADSGYRQADVSEFAKALTGWSVGRVNRNEPASFLFRPNTHEPGSRSILGKSYSQETAKRGYVQAQRILSDFAAHPKTAERLCYKLARHFIADEPPLALVEKMKDAYLKNNGSIPIVMAEMLDHPSSWSDISQKLKTPRDFVLSTYRTFNIKRPKPNIFQTLEIMGQGFFNSGSPAGYPDVSSAWSGSQAITTRIEWAHHVAGQIEMNAIDAAKIALGPLLSEKTRLLISRAESQRQAITYLLLSPEFQRR